LINLVGHDIDLILKLLLLCCGSREQLIDRKLDVLCVCVLSLQFDFENLIEGMDVFEDFAQPQDNVKDLSRFSHSRDAKG